MASGQPEKAFQVPAGHSTESQAHETISYSSPGFRGATSSVVSPVLIPDCKPLGAGTCSLTSCNTPSILKEARSNKVCKVGVPARHPLPGKTSPVIADQPVPRFPLDMLTFHKRGGCVWVWFFPPRRGFRHATTQTPAQNDAIQNDPHCIPFFSTQVAKQSQQIPAASLSACTTKAACPLERPALLESGLLQCSAGWLVFPCLPLAKRLL